jgi:N-methylhydantoinase A/oxoprolinase/acetone carboxylase beta subunit
MVEFVTWKMTAVGSTNPPPAARQPEPGGGLPPPAPKSTRPVYLGPALGLAQAPVYAGSDCAGGSPVAGPAVIEEETMTLLLLPGMTARTDTDGNYWIDRN